MVFDYQETPADVAVMLGRRLRRWTSITATSIARLQARRYIWHPTPRGKTLQMTIWYT